MRIDKSIAIACIEGFIVIPSGNNNQSEVNITLSKTLESKRHEGAECASMLRLLNGMEIKIHI